MSFNILVMREFELVRHTEDEYSHLIGQLEVGDGCAYNDHLNGLLEASQYRCEDFYFTGLESEEKLRIFFDALDDLTGAKGIERYNFSLNCAKTWRGKYLKIVRKRFNENASIIFHDNGALDQLTEKIDKNEFILTYLKLSQAFNFAKNGLIQFTEKDFLS